MCRGYPWVLQPQQNPTGTTKVPIPHLPHIPVSLGGDLSPGQHSTQTLLTDSFHLKSSQTLLSPQFLLPLNWWPGGLDPLGCSGNSEHLGSSHSKILVSLIFLWI